MDFAAYFAGKKLTSDWTTHNIKDWVRVLEPRRSEALKVLEIGSFEGRSALFFLNYLPNAKLTCIDTFSGGIEHLEKTSPLYVKKIDEIEKHFDENLAPFSSRIEKCKGRSLDLLANLGLKRRSFDLVFVDGSHVAIDVYRDAVLAWPLLVPGGIMILDDYQWEKHLPPEDRPELAINAFLELIAGHYQGLHRGYQVIIKKLRRAMTPAEDSAVAGNSNGFPTEGKAGRNDPCPCGSGKKYKKCHGRLA